MSKAGIQRFAKALADLQQGRQDLMILACGSGEKPKRKADTQDLRLAQLLDEAKDAVKLEFARITLEKT